MYQGREDSYECQCRKAYEPHSETTSIHCEKKKKHHCQYPPMGNVASAYLAAAYNVLGVPCNQVLIKATMELFGSFMFGIILYATMAVYSVILPPSFAILACVPTALAALSLGVIVWFTNGATCNPAVTLAQLIYMQITFWEFLAVVIAQFGGWVLAAVVVNYGLWVTDISYAAPVLMIGASKGAGIIAEGIATMLLVLVFIGAKAVNYRGFAPVFVAITHVALMLSFGPLTGAFMNPWRVLATELLANSWTNAWVWYVGAFSGALIAAAFAWIWNYASFRRYTDSSLFFAYTKHTKN